MEVSQHERYLGKRHAIGEPAVGMRFWHHSRLRVSRFLPKLLKVMGAALKGRGFKPRRKAPYIQQRL